MFFSSQKKRKRSKKNEGIYSSLLLFHSFIPWVARNDIVMAGESESERGICVCAWRQKLHRKEKEEEKRINYTACQLSESFENI
jgi:hypothetical protein